MADILGVLAFCRWRDAFAAGRLDDAGWINWAEIGSLAGAVVVLGFVIELPHMSWIESFT